MTLETLRERLEEIIEPQFVDAWLNTPLPALDYLSPLEAIASGQSARLDAVLYRLGSGEPG